MIDLPGGQVIDSQSGKHYFLPFLPATPSRTLEVHIELTPVPSPCVLLLELQRYKDTVRCVVLGTEVP